MPCVSFLVSGPAKRARPIWHSDGRPDCAPVFGRLRRAARPGRPVRERQGHGGIVCGGVEERPREEQTSQRRLGGHDPARVDVINTNTSIFWDEDEQG